MKTNKAGYLMSTDQPSANKISFLQLNFNKDWRTAQKTVQIDHHLKVKAKKWLYEIRLVDWYFKRQHIAVIKICAIIYLFFSVFDCPKQIKKKFF